MKTKIPTYNDGMVSFYKRKKENLTQNRNITSLNELNFMVSLAYSETSRRQQDLEFAEQNSFSLSMKIKTPRPPMDPGLNSQCFVVVNQVLYAVQYIDTNQREFYCYLEKIRELKGEANELE